MHTHEDIKKSPIYRFSEKAVPLFVWLFITMPVWLSPFHPAIASYIILAYFLYFFYKTIKSVYYSTISMRLIQRAARTDWAALVKESEGYHAIEHYVMIVSVRESTTKLAATLDCLKNQTFNRGKIHVILAMEDREGESARERSRELHAMYKNEFASIDTTYHVLVPGEVIGKASNGTFAAKHISADLKKRKIDPRNALLTVCDADSLLPEEYLSYMTYKYLHESDPEYKFFAAPVLLYNHFWKLPFPVRMSMMLSSVMRLSFLSQKEDLIQISTYSTNMWLMESIGYWDVDIIPEDWHIWMQAFYTLGEKVKTVPIYLPIIRDGVLGLTLAKTLRARYEQEKRWAWGVTDIPYSLTRFFSSTHIPLLVRLRRILFLMEGQFLWPTGWFILTLGATLPALVNPVFGRTVLGFLLPQVASFILTVATVMLVFALYFDFELRKRANIDTSWRQVPLLFVQWFFLPVVSFAFSSLPALEAHTRMLLGKKMEYRVTEKVG